VNKDDAWQASVTREAAEAVGEWLVGRGGLERPIRTLVIGDLEAMAVAAISLWIKRSSERQASPPP